MDARRRRTGTAVAVPLLAVLLATGAQAGSAPRAASPGGERTAPDSRLDVGESTFWRSQERLTAPVPQAAFVGAQVAAVGCAAGTSACVTYPLTVAPGGHRLRAAVDWPGFLDPFQVELLDPSGRSVATGFGQYSAEAFAAQPVGGTWTVRVSSAFATDAAFRGRALLEEAPKPDAGPVRDELPNLKLQPPFEFSLAGPDGNCYASEKAQYAAVRCLRFSTGPANHGRGPVDLRLRPSSPASPTGTTVQRVRRTDGTFRERQAGPYEFHAEHNHYHHTGVAGFDLFRYDPRTGARALVGRSPKQGYCMVDSVISEWRQFRAEPARDLVGYGDSCGFAGIGVPSQTATGADIGLSVGWGDIYTSRTEANFVEFSAAGDGTYVIAGTTDPADAAAPGGTIVESDEADNDAYALIRVEGDCVRVLERGYGPGPWAPTEVLEDIRALTYPGQCVAG